MFRIITTSKLRRTQDMMDHLKSELSHAKLARVRAEMRHKTCQKQAARYVANLDACNHELAAIKQAISTLPEPAKRRVIRHTERAANASHTAKGDGNAIG